MRRTHAAPANPNGSAAALSRRAARRAAAGRAVDRARHAPHETAERLLGATDGALARQTLLQAASLPEQPGGRAAEAATQRWTFEVPFATPQGTAHRAVRGEPRRQHGPQTNRMRAIWRARFSLDLEPMGPVHALVALAGERASVTLWAERAATATRLNEQCADA